MGRDERLGALTLVTAPVRELVSVQPTRLTVQLFFATNLVEPLVPGGTVTAVGLAVNFGLGNAHAVASSGPASVGEVSLPEQASAAESNRDAIIGMRIIVSCAVLLVCGLGGSRKLLQGTTSRYRDGRGKPPYR